MADAISLSKYITGEKDATDFEREFSGKYSAGFDINRNLDRIGVVNQTTMLASDTQEISDFLKQVMLKKYNLNDNNIEERFADTRDTLCYATNDNQSAVYGLLETPADLAIVVGGYNSSNTSHLVELCEGKLPTYFINSADKIISSTEIIHFNLHKKQEAVMKNFLPETRNLTVLITSGASCPDALVEEVINKLISFFPTGVSAKELITHFA